MTTTAEIRKIKRNIRTRTGDSNLYKLWNEQDETIISLWDDSDDSDPLLAKAKRGDTIRLAIEVHEELDENGNTVERREYTVVPPKS